MENFVTDPLDLILRDTFDRLEIRRVLGDQSALLQERDDVGQFVLSSKLLHITKQSGLGDIGQRILDPEERGGKLVFSLNQELGVSHILCGEVAVQVDLLDFRFFLRFNVLTRASTVEVEGIDG